MIGSLIAKRAVGEGSKAMNSRYHEAAHKIWAESAIPDRSARSH
jgi:hypothetical protein